MAREALEWCTCPGGGEVAYYCLIPKTPSQLDVWVHSTCSKPTFPWWRHFEKYCDECGRSFSSPLDDVCASCGGRTWADALRLYIDRMWALGIELEPIDVLV